MSNLTVKEIIIEYLRANGYDGLYNEGVCGCELDDLEPCCEVSSNCAAGHFQRCNCGEGCEDFHIGPAKQEGE